MNKIDEFIERLVMGGMIAICLMLLSLALSAPRF